MGDTRSSELTLAFYETLEVGAVLLQVDFCEVDNELLKVVFGERM